MGSDLYSVLNAKNLRRCKAFVIEIQEKNVSYIVAICEVECKPVL